MTNFGCWFDIPSPFIAEMIGVAGYDFCVIDLEHGPMSLETATLSLMALEAAPTMPIVRVTEGTEGQIKRALDAGAKGVMVPRVETPMQAEAMVEFFRYPPRGIRGSAQSVIRASGYGLNAQAYTESFAEQHLLALQIESVAGFAAREAIAATDGVGMLFFGPADYAASLGVPIDHEEVLRAAKAVAGCAASHGLLAGTVLFPGSTPAVLAAAGMTHISVAGDIGVLMSGLTQALSAAREETDGQ